MFHSIWPFLFLLFSTHAIAQQTTNGTSKFKTLPPPNTDQVGSQLGQSIVPLIQVNATDFVIGGLFGLTNGPGGPPELKGIQRAVAFECAITSLNNNKTMDSGRRYYYYMVNDSNSQPEAMSAAVNLIENGVQAVVGASSSATTLSSAALLTSFNLTLLGPSASSVELNNVERYPTFLRVGSSDYDQAAAIASTMVYFNWSLVTPIYTNDPYGLSGQSQFVVQAQNNRILLTCGRVINPGQLNGIPDTIRCLTNSFSNVVLLWMNQENAANVIAAFYAAGGNLSRLTFIAVDSWANTVDFDQFSRGRFPKSYLEGTLDFSPRLGDQSLFAECLAGQNPSTSDIPGFDFYWETSFRCIYTDDQAVPLCPPEIDKRPFNPPTCRCDGTENLADFPQENAVAYYYDSVYAIGGAFKQIKENCTGLTQALGTDYCRTTNLTTTEFQRVVAYTMFDGATGLIDFESNNRQNLTYEIRQRGANWTSIKVGEYDGDAVTFDTKLFRFKKGKTPESYIVPQQVLITDPIGIIFLMLTVIALAISIGFSITFFIYRKEKVVKKTSPFFSQLILIGIDLCLLSQIVWSLKQTEIWCILKVSLLAIGFGLIMGNLLAKNWRIYKIFNSSKMTSLVIKDTDLLKFSGVILVIEVALLLCYFLLSGPPRPIEIQSTSDSLLLIIQCAVPSAFIQLFFTIALLVFNGLLILCGVVLAYKSRNVEGSFNESKYIGITVYIYLLVIIILLPLYYTAGDSGSSVTRQFILRNISVLAAMYFTLVALFVPKLMSIREERKARAAREASRAATDTSNRTRRIVSQYGTSNMRETTPSVTADQSGLFSRLLTSQGGSVSFGGRDSGTYTGGRDSGTFGSEGGGTGSEAPIPQSTLLNRTTRRF